MKWIKKRNGFTLVELLITIAIISIVFGIGGTILFNIINNFKEESASVAKTNILNTAHIYVKEYTDEVSWNQLDTQNEKYEEKKEQKFTCVSINELINKNLLKKDIKDTDNLSNYIIVWKNENGSIVSEEFDATNLCGDTDMSAKIPTKEDYCQNLVYNGSTHILTKTSNEKFSFINNEGIDAGTYKVTAKLNNGYHWNDGTKDDKKISCSIKKAIPTMTIEPQIITDTPLVGEIIEVSITHEIGGKLTVKSSNNDYFEVSVDGNTNIIANETKNISIKFLSEREINGYITITVTPTPDNAKNYYNNTETIYIGNPERKQVTIPTEDNYCKNPYYNGSTQTLIKDDLIKEASTNGIVLSNTEAKDIGNYEVTAKLKYGYEWTDGRTDNKTFTCSIKKPTPTVTYVNGDGCNSKVVTYKSTYGELCVPTKTGYTFNGWYTQASNGTIVKKDTKVTNFKDHSIYAQWTANRYKVYYNGNGYTKQTYTDDTECNTSNQCGLNRYTNSSIFENDTFKHASNHVYDNPWTLIKNRFEKTGHTFNGWALTSTGRTKYQDQEQVNNLTATNNGTVTLYAQWTPNTYTIKFNPNGGTGTISNINYTYGISTILPNGNSFKKTGYTISSWNTKADGSGYSYACDGKTGIIKNLLSPTNTITLYAQWTPNTYTIEYKGNGNTDGWTSNSSHTYDVIQPLTANRFLKNGYTFNGWNTKKDGTGTSYANKKQIKNLTATNNGTITLYAKWKANTYKVYYSGNGYTSQTYNDNTECNSSNECGLNRYTSGTTFENDIFKHASNYVYDNTWTLIKNRFEKTGHTFNGWALTSTGSTKYQDQEQVNNLTATNNGTVTLYAKWKTNTYTIKYNANGGTGTMADTTVTYDVSTTIRKNTFTRTNYTFTGWTAYRKSDSKWYWKKSDGNYGWYKDGSQPSGATKYIYKDETNVSKTSAVNGDTVTFYAQWKPAVMYLCRSTQTASYTPGQTKIHAQALNNCLYENAPASCQYKTIKSGSPVYILGESGLFYKIQLHANSEIIDNNSYYANGNPPDGDVTKGYIYKGCLSTTKPSSSFWCDATECIG